MTFDRLIAVAARWAVRLFWAWLAGVSAYCLLRALVVLLGGAW